MGFEENAINLHNSEELLDINNNPVIQMLWDLGNICLPGLSVAEGTINSILEQRVKTKLTILLKEIIECKEHITKEQLQNVDAINMFILMMDAVNKATCNEKIRLYGRLYANTCIETENINVNEYEEWLHGLSDLSYREIFILLTLYQYEKNYKSDKSYGDICKYRDEFIEKIGTKFDLSEEDLYSILQGMLRTGFYYNDSNILAAIDRKYKKGHTTSYFEKFAEKIN